MTDDRQNLMNENWNHINTEEKYNKMMEMFAKETAKQTFVDLFRTPSGFEFEMNREGKRSLPHKIEDEDELMGTYCIPLVPHETAMLLQIMTRKGGEIADAGDDPMPHLMRNLAKYRWEPEKD